MNGEELMNLLKRLNHENIKIVFDTGNRVAFGHNLPEDIKLLGNNIEHVHIKDKTYKNKNVIIGRGDVDFDIIFEKLKDIKYKKNFTFETNKGVNPIKTSLNNIKFIEKMIRKHRLI